MILERVDGIMAVRIQFAKRHSNPRLHRVQSRTTELESFTRDAVMIERIGERHASACRYNDEAPEGSRRSARRTHFWHVKYKHCRPR